MAPTVEKEMNGIANQTTTPAGNIIATYATMYANVRSANYKTTIVYIYIYIYIKIRAESASFFSELRDTSE